jgi:hypothetical protein
MLVGDQSNLPDEMANNKGRNTYYLLPLLMGLIGLFYQAFAGGEKGIQGFWVHSSSSYDGFGYCGLLNQTPFQPREGDYAYAGSSMLSASGWVLVCCLDQGAQKINAGQYGSSFGNPSMSGCACLDDAKTGTTTIVRTGPPPGTLYNLLMSCDEIG